MHLQVALLLPLSFLPMALATSPATMALLVVPAGVLIAPLIATRNELAGKVALGGDRDGGLHLAADRAGRRDRARRGASGALAGRDELAGRGAGRGRGAAGVGAVVGRGRRATLVPGA